MKMKFGLCARDDMKAGDRIQTEERRWLAKKEDGIVPSMSKLEAIEKRVSGLSAEELAEFRQWFAEFDAAAWDRQIERDVKAGKLDELADQALRQHAAGKSTEF
jgi:hypothetical protein